MATIDLNYTNQVTFNRKWYPLIRVSNNMYVMTARWSGGVQYVPLYIHHFRLLQPCRQLAAERFNLQYTDPSKITTVKDRLRYYRNKKALRQQDVADKTGIHRATYCAYEQEDRKTPYPLDKLNKIAKLFGVVITDLLDNYNLFLYNGQGEQIRALRQSLGLTKKEFGKRYGFHAHTVNQWEKDKIQILKSTWEKLFANDEKQVHSNKW